MVGLLCQYNPSAVLWYLQHGESYDLKEAAAQCRAAGVQEGEAYLHEKMGDVDAAMRIYVEAVDTANKNLRKVLTATPQLLYDIDRALLASVGRGAKRWASKADNRPRARP